MVLVLAVPSIFMLCAALGACLLAFVFRKAIGDLVVAIFQGIPLVGEHIVHAVQWAIEQADKGAKVVLDAAVKPLTDMIDLAVGSAMAGVAWLTAAALWLGVTLKGILAFTATQIRALQVVLDATVSMAIKASVQLVAQAATLATLGARVAYVLATAIPAAIAQAIGQAVAKATILVNAAKSLLVAGINAALATALRAVGNEAAARAASDAAVKAYAAAQTILLGQHVGQELAQLGNAIDAQVGQLGQAIDNIGAKIGPIAYPTVAIAITAITATITQLTRTCVTPTCNYLGPQLQALELAMDVTMLLAVGELVAAAANDPQGAAQTQLQTVGPLVGMVAGLFSDMTGQPIRAA